MALRIKIQSSESGSLPPSVLRPSVFSTSHCCFSCVVFVFVFSSNVLCLYPLWTPTCPSRFRSSTTSSGNLSLIASFWALITFADSSTFALNKLPYRVLPVCLPLWTAGFLEGRTVLILWTIATSPLPPCLVQSVFVEWVNACMSEWNWRITEDHPPTWV